MKPYFRWTQFIPTYYVCNAATLGPLGFWTKAPGTVGSVAGLLWYVVAFYYLNPFAYLLLAVFTCYLAIAFCGEAELRMGQRDPGHIILDEFVAMPLCFLGLPVYGHAYPWLTLLVGFSLFRFFDILKPLGIGKLQDLPEGSGVVMDDVGAALATCICLHVAYAWV